MRDGFSWITSQTCSLSVAPKAYNLSQRQTITRGLEATVRSRGLFLNYCSKVLALPNTLSSW